MLRWMCGVPRKDNVRNDPRNNDNNIIACRGGQSTTEMVRADWACDERTHGEESGEEGDQERGGDDDR